MFSGLPGVGLAQPRSRLQSASSGHVREGVSLQSKVIEHGRRRQHDVGGVERVEWGVTLMAGYLAFVGTVDARQQALDERSCLREADVHAEGLLEHDGPRHAGDEHEDRLR